MFSCNRLHCLLDNNYLAPHRLFPPHSWKVRPEPLKHRTLWRFTLIIITSYKDHTTKRYICSNYPEHSQLRLRHPSSNKRKLRSAQTRRTGPIIVARWWSIRLRAMNTPSTGAFRNANLRSRRRFGIRTNHTFHHSRDDGSGQILSEKALRH
jgi:hypothetical protein